MQENNDTLALLDRKFRDIETKSQSILSIPKNHFLAIRLDGFHATKKYLKNSLENKEFRDNFSSAITSTAGGLNAFFKSKLPNLFVCAFAVNDEVSIVFNASLEDNAERRLLKVCTLISSALSVNFKPLGPKREKVIFDARPILLEDKNDVCDYLKYRYLLSVRYGYWKVLRLKNHHFRDIDVCHDDIKCNLDNAKNLTISKGLKKDFNIFRQNLIFYYPKDVDGKRKIFKKIFDPDSNLELLR